MKYILILLVSAGLAGCKNNSSTASAGNIDSSAKPFADTAVKAYFPVIDFLKGEISAVDSLPVGILKYTTRGKKIDSAYIKPEEFHRLANEFLPAELQSPGFEKEFIETSFFDKSTHSSTFLYTTKNRNLSLQRVDVLSASGEVYDKIKSIYIEKIARSGDTAITQKLYWKPERNFQMSTLTTKGSGEPAIELIKVVWDNRD